MTLQAACKILPAGCLQNMTLQDAEYDHAGCLQNMTMQLQRNYLAGCKMRPCRMQNMTLQVAKANYPVSYKIWPCRLQNIKLQVAKYYPAGCLPYMTLQVAEYDPAGCKILSCKLQNVTLLATKYKHCRQQGCLQNVTAGCQRWPCICQIWPCRLQWNYPASCKLWPCRLLAVKYYTGCLQNVIMQASKKL